MSSTTPTGAHKVVYVLVHDCYEIGGDYAEEPVKFIGAYASRWEAVEALRRLMSQPGFRETPDGFAIDEHELGEEGWEEGYFIARY